MRSRTVSAFAVIVLVLFLADEGNAEIYRAKEQLLKRKGTPFEHIARRHLEKEKERRENLLTEMRTQSRRGYISDLKAVVDPVGYRDELFGIVPTENEHACHKGLLSAFAPGGRCEGNEKHYDATAVGEVAEIKQFADAPETWELEYKSSLVHVWRKNNGSDASPKSASDKVIAAIKILENFDNLAENEPLSNYVQGSSQLEVLCKFLGPYPFHFTCDGRLQVLVHKCGVVNAFAYIGAVAQNGTSVHPANGLFTTMCEEFLPSASPSTISNVITHEAFHLIQAGFGSGATVHLEGGATFSESSLLGNPFRSLTYASSSSSRVHIVDWNKLNGANIFSSDALDNAGKYYTIHSYLYAYLAKVVGQDRISAVMNMVQQFPGNPLLFGQDYYEVFLQGTGNEDDWEIPVNVTANGYSDVIAKFWVSVFTSCSDDAPTDLTFDLFNGKPRYWLWDCSAFDTFYSGRTSFTGSVEHALRFGASRVTRINTPKNVRLTAENIEDGAYIFVIADPVDGPPEVLQLETTLYLPGEYEFILVVQSNANTESNFLSEDVTAWRLSEIAAFDSNTPSWRLGYPERLAYGDLWVAGLLSPEFTADSNTLLNFDIQFLTETPNSEPFDVGCLVLAWDGLFVRVWTSETEWEIIDPTEGPEYLEGLYAALSNGELSGPDPCDTRGWAGDTGGWVHTSFNLSAYAGEAIRFELLFLSDEYSTAVGAWADNFRLTVGGEVILDDDGSNSVMTPTMRPPGPADGERDWLNRPYTLRNNGKLHDRYGFGFAKTVASAWNAKWDNSDEESLLQRDFLGSEHEVTSPPFPLRPWEELLFEFVAPYDGEIDYVSWFLNVQISGIEGYQITLRDSGRDLIAQSAEKSFGFVSSNLAYPPGVVTESFEDNPELESGETYYVGLRMLSEMDPAEVLPAPLYWYATIPTNSAGTPSTHILCLEDGADGCQAGTFKSPYGERNAIVHFYYKQAQSPEPEPCPEVPECPKCNKEGTQIHLNFAGMIPAETCCNK